MKILVTGSRYWKPLDHLEIIVRELEKFPAGTVLVHGDCIGVDKMADVIGREMGFDVRPYPADWTKFKRKAGPIRNREMLKKEHLANEPIDLVLAFHDDLENGSSGTKDMVDVARKASIEVRLITV